MAEWRFFVVNRHKENRIALENIVRTFKKCTDEKRKRVLHMKIIEQAMVLVRMISVPIASQMSLPTEDIMQVGALGLIKAIEFYVPDKNAKFETYANYFIKGEIRHYVRDKANFIKTPRKIQELLFKINAAQKTLMNKGENDVTEEMLADVVGIPVKQISEVLEYEKYKTMISLDQAVNPGEEEETALLDKIPADDSYWSWDLYEDKLMLSDAINKLPPEQKSVIELSYYQDLSQREIASRLNISQMQVSRQLKKALSSLYEIVKRN